MKRMLLIFFLFATTFSYAQDRKEEMLESLRIAFISKQLELTPSEAEKFWPVYNGYHGDMGKLMRDHQDKRGSELDLEEKVLNLRKRYKPEFTKAISEQKFDRLMKAERSWGEMLRKELQRRREGGERPMGGERPPMNRPRQGGGGPGLN